MKCSITYFQSFVNKLEQAGQDWIFQYRVPAAHIVIAQWLAEQVKAPLAPTINIIFFKSPGKTTMHLKHKNPQVSHIDKDLEIFGKQLSILFWIIATIFLLAGPTIFIYQKVVIGESVLVASEIRQMRATEVRKDSYKYSCVSFYDLRDDYQHGCHHTSMQTAQQYNQGEVYLVTRQLWKNNKMQYYRFPELR